MCTVPYFIDDDFLIKRRGKVCVQLRCFLLYIKHVSYVEFGGSEDARRYSRTVDKERRSLAIMRPAIRKTIVSEVRGGWRQASGSAAGARHITPRNNTRWALLFPFRVQQFRLFLLLFLAIVISIFLLTVTWLQLLFVTIQDRTYDRSVFIPSTI